MKKTTWYLSVIMICLFTGFTSCKNQKDTATESDVVENQNDSKLNDSTTANNTTTTSAANDAQFLMDAADINLQEIALGQLAKKNTKNPDVLALAKMMVEDHTKALDEVKALADKKSITLPSTPSETPSGLVDKKGKDFDRAYCDEMVTGHQKAITKFETEISGGSDADAKAWANKMLPGLKTHLEHSQDYQKKVSSTM